MNNGRSKKTTVFMLVITIAIVLAALLFINSRTAPKSSFFMDGRKKLTVTGEVSAVSNSNSRVYCMKDLLIEAQDMNLRVKDIKGNVAWSQKLSAQITDLAAAGENIVINDSENNIYYYSLQGKPLWTYKVEQKIIDMFTEDNGSLLVEYKGMTGSHAEVFTQNGSKIGSISIENAQILSFSAGEEVFSISVLDTSAEAIKTKIITYNFKGDILWAQNFENKIISKLNYGKNSSLIAIGENIIYTYAKDGSLKEELRIEGEISNVAMSDYLVTMAVKDKGKKYIVCYDANMREQSRTEIEKAPLGIFPSKSSFVLYYNDEFLVLTPKGELISRFKSNSEISSVYLEADGKLYVVSNRKLQMLEYAK